MSDKIKRLPILGKRLNKLRGGVSQAEFAKRVGLTAATVGYYENSERLPDAETLRKICVSCGVSADYLLGLDVKEKIYPDTPGGRLKKLLHCHPKTQERTSYKMLGEYLGVTQQSVSLWANDESNPTAKLIAPIADYFGVTCDYLLRGMDGEL